MDTHREVVVLFPVAYDPAANGCCITPVHIIAYDFLSEIHVVSSENNLFHFAMLSFVYYGML